MKEFVFPKAIVQSSSCDHADTLLKKKTLQINLAERELARFEQQGHIILDFGLEMRGGVRILTYSSDRSELRIRFGESVGECCAEIGEKNAGFDHAPRDFRVKLPGLCDFEIGGTGFRFVRLDFGGRTALKSVVAANEILNKKPKYLYTGGDQLTKDIFYTAKRTIDLCAAGDYLWDGVKRDRLVWVGDMHPEMLALTALYGRSPALERSLDLAKKDYPLPNWMNTDYPSYSMWWLIILADYARLCDRWDFARKNIKYVEGLAAQLDDHVDECGEMHYPRYFLDWANKGGEDEVAGVRCVNILAAKAAITLLAREGRSTLRAESLLKKLLKVKIDIKKSKQALGLKYFAVGLDESDKEKLARGGAEGMSCFMSYYILKAVASFDKPLAIKMMKDYYGGMLKMGATTFWEDFDVEWLKNAAGLDRFPMAGEHDIHGDNGRHCYVGFRHSLCHGWSAGVIKFIEEMENEKC